ncbi:MAG: leucine-rich repeat domain-containing protein, partial [Cohaesibacter sp.]|nr:leucine-rich repeat domain-containing protein [Cohaesibacter sp.]
CQNLREITIPRRVLTIGVGAFIGCSSLRSIYMHTSLGYDAEEAFDEDVLDFLTLFEDDSSGPSQTPFWQWTRENIYKGIQM